MAVAWTTWGLSLTGALGYFLFIIVIFSEYRERFPSWRKTWSISWSLVSAEVWQSTELYLHL